MHSRSMDFAELLVMRRIKAIGRKVCDWSARFCSDAVVKNLRKLPKLYYRPQRDGTCNRFNFLHVKMHCGIRTDIAHTRSVLLRAVKVEDPFSGVVLRPELPPG